MEESVIARRTGDVVISVRQDNVQKDISISNMNECALKMLGFSAKDGVVGSSFYSILEPRTKYIINSNLEYTSEGTDLSDIISKIRNFSLLDNKLQVISVHPKVFRTTSDKNSLNYEILLRDTSLSQKLDAFRGNKLSPNFKYDIHKTFGVLDEKSTKTEVEVVLDFVTQNGKDAVIAAIAFDNAPDNDDEQETLAKMLVDAVHENIRYTDIVGYWGEYRFVFVLLGCKSADAYSAVSRVHKGVGAKLSARFSPAPTVSVGFSQMCGAADHIAILNRLDKALTEGQEEGGSAIKLSHT